MSRQTVADQLTGLLRQAGGLAMPLLGGDVGRMLDLARANVRTIARPSAAA